MNWKHDEVCCLKLHSSLNNKKYKSGEMTCSPLIVNHFKLTLIEALKGYVYCLTLGLIYALRLVYTSPYSNS